MENLNRDDVVSIELINSFTGSSTFTVEEASLKLAKFTDERTNLTGEMCKRWAQDGIPCRVLRVNGDGWKSGSVRISLEFIPAADDVADD